MKLPALIPTLLLLCSCFILSGQESDTILIGQFFAKKAGGKVVLQGTVSNPETGELLEGAAVSIPEIDIGTVTNEKGQYGFLLPIGAYTVRVQYIGLEPVSRKIRIYDDGILDFGLHARAYSLREVIVESTMDNKNVKSASTGIAQLKLKEIRALPTFLGEVDVVKSLLSLPGVSTVGEGASGFNVRGGRIDQNLVQLNGAYLYNPSHVLGFFSAFNPDVVESFTLYKGHVPAQFGGRASSVLDVFVKNGSFEEHSYRGGLGLVASRFVVEGPIVKDKTSFLLGGRASYSDWLLRLVRQPEIRQSAASFYDVNAIVAHRLNIDHQLTFSYYQSNDLFRYAREFGYAYGTQTATLKWNGIFSNQFSTSTFLGFGNYQSRSFVPAGIDGFDLENGIRYYQFKQDFFYVPDRHTIRFGLEANFNRMKPDELAPRGQNSAVISQWVERDQSREFALYFNDEYAVSDKLSVNLGLRYSFYQQTGADRLYLYDPQQPMTSFSIIDTLYYRRGQAMKTYGGLEPRIALRIEAGKNGAFKLSYNRLRQYIHLISNSTAPTPVDIWQVSTPYIPPQIADNWSAGYFRNFNRNVWETSLEFYYKNIDNLIDYKDFPELLLNDHLETDLISGQGRAYGVELYIRRKVGRWTGWLSYVWSRTEIRLDDETLDRPVNNGDWYPTSYDQPHNINFVGKRQMGKRSYFSFNFTYRTGRPITGLVSNYEQNYSSIPHFSERNQYRIPDYYRLDISLLIAGAQKPGKRFESNLAFSVYNLLGRRNAFSVFYKRPAERIVIPKAFQLSVLGSPFPAVTYNFSF